jgi:hypothetical protein
MIDEGKKDELDESDKVLLIALCWVDNTTFILHISEIGLISGDKALLLLEARESKDMKEMSKLEKTKGLLLIYRLSMSIFQLFLSTNISFNLFPRMVKLRTGIGSVYDGIKQIQSNVGLILKTGLNIGLPCNRNIH